MSGTAPWRIWIDRRPPPEVAIPGDIELTGDLAVADGAVVGADRSWDAEACRHLPRLKVVARAGIGYDNVEVAECAAAGVAACNAPDAPTVSTAEHALALLLAVSKRIKVSERRLGTALGTTGPHRAWNSRDGSLGLLGLRTHRRRWHATEPPRHEVCWWHDSPSRRLRDGRGGASGGPRRISATAATCCRCTPPHGGHPPHRGTRAIAAMRPAVLIVTAHGAR